MLEEIASPVVCADADNVISGKESPKFGTSFYAGSILDEILINLSNPLPR